jgi:O-antigen/teichoic acid export membrane protein
VSEARRLIKNTGIIAVGGAATKLVQFLLLPLYTSVLSTVEYGTVDYLNTVALFCVPAVSLLMDEALFRFLIDAGNFDDRKRMVTTSCAIVAVGCALLSLCSVIWMLLGFGGGFLWVAMLVIAGVSLQMVSAILRGFGETVKYALLNFVASFAMIAMNVVFIAVFQWGVAGMLLATILAQAGSSFIFFIWFRMWRYMSISSLDRGLIGSFVRYSVPLIPNKVSWTIMNMSSRLVIMNALGAASAGIFAVSYKFPNVMDQIYGFFYMSWKESSARALNSDEDEAAFYNAVYRTLSRFMMSVVLCMTVLMPTAYSVLIDGAYREGLKYVPILLMATYFSNISGFYGGIFTAHKDTGIMGATTIVSAAICLALNLVMIPSVGLYGAAISTLVSMIVVNEYRRIKVRRHARLAESVRERALTLISIAVVFGSFYCYIYKGNTLSLIVGLLIAATYSVVANLAVIRRLIQSITVRHQG